MAQPPDQQQVEYRPDRRMDPYAARFWEFTRVRELRLQRCAECSKFRWPPAPVCDACLSERFDWELVSGRGTVLSWVTFRRQYFSEYPAGHQPMSVELDEGPLFISFPVEMGEQQLAAGMQMELTWRASADRFGEYNLPVFRPAQR